MEEKKNKKIVIAIICIVLVVIGVVLAIILLSKDKSNEGEKEVKKTPEVMESPYSLSGNSLDDFDLYFMQLNNKEENVVYSPLSIKYALQMLADGAEGNTKAQILGILGNYKAVKYANSKNMSFANALFIKNEYAGSIKDSYKDLVKNKYNAEVIYNSFKSPDNLNSWVSDKTFNLINDLFKDVSEKDFILVNALGIDMEWENLIQSIKEDYYAIFAHEDFGAFVIALEMSDYYSLEFNNGNINAKSVEIGAVANKYDIVNTLGEDYIRKLVGDELRKWKEQNPGWQDWYEEYNDEEKYLDKYIEELDDGYGHLSSSTDFYFYDDENVKAFAKDLKEYNGTTLEYVGIMPKNNKLAAYIKNMNADSINAIINNLKPIAMDSFKDGVITYISGYIPLFKMDYKLDLVNNLKRLGITDVFDDNKVDLSNLTTEKSKIVDAAHEANIEFSNEGIKAAAATEIGGWGNAVDGFNYSFDVPVEKIDLTFDNPYLYLIRDKNTGEVWFAGTVYEPIDYVH